MPLVTLDGIKVIDVVWMSAGYFRELEAKEPLVLERAPEICVEVLSPSNSELTLSAGICKEPRVAVALGPRRAVKIYSSNSSA